MILNRCPERERALRSGLRRWEAGRSTICWAAIWPTAQLLFCSATLFMIPGIFPIVPGAGIYWTAHYIVTDQLALASRTGFEAVKAAAAIVLGIIFVFEIPQRFFGRIAKRKE